MVHANIKLTFYYNQPIIMFINEKQCHLLPLINVFIPYNACDMDIVYCTKRLKRMDSFH